MVYLVLLDVVIRSGKNIPSFQFNRLFTSGKSWISWIVDEFAGICGQVRNFGECVIDNCTADKKWPVWL